MTRAFPFILTVAAIGFWMLAAILVEHTAPNDGLPIVQADFRSCTTTRTGPIQRPDNYNIRPYRRKADAA